MPKIILCRGIPGSGKTFWAKEWVLKDSEHRVRFNNDDIRNMLGEYWVPKRESLVEMLKYHFVHETMNKNYDIVIDNMNLNPKEIKVYENWIEKHNHFDFCFKYKLEFKNFNTPLDICIIRDSNRERPIGKDIITATYNKHKDVIDEFTQIENGSR